MAHNAGIEGDSRMLTLQPKMSFRFLVSILAGVIFSSAGPLPAQLVNVDFNRNDGVSWGGHGPDPGPTMAGAGVMGNSGDVWNGINVSSGSGMALVFANGGASPVHLTFTSGGGYDVYSFNGSTPFAGTPYDNLMQDYLFSGGSPQTILLSGLAPNAMFHLILYSAADTGATNRTTYFTVNGISQSSTWNGTTGALLAGANFVQFNSALSDGFGQLAVTYRGDGSLEGDVNGFQIQPATLKIAAAVNGTNVVISFLTQSGLNYQVQYKNSLADTGWTALGAVAGDNSLQTMNDAPGGGRRFYRVQISTNAAPALRLLHAGGTNIVDASGAIVPLRGLNLGGWFIMEKWMCPLDSGSLPDTYSAITNLDRRFGVATEQALIRAYQTNWITTDDLNNLTNGGYNCVRMPVWWGNFYSITNTTSSGWRADAFDVLDWLVTNCAARGIYVIIDLHGVVGGQSASDSTGWQNQNKFWTNSLDQSQTAYLWAQIAAHYRGNPAVAGYDLINEPFGTTSTAVVWPVYTNLYTTIRSVDPSHIIFIEGTYGNWDWNMLPDPSLYGWSNVVYQMHEYQWGGSVAQIEAGADHQVADFHNHLSWNVPGYVGEWNNMGMGAACYQYSINAYDHAGLSWSLWSYKATHGLLPDGWAWYDPVFWPPTPNLQSDPAITIVNDWKQWRTTNSFGMNPAVGL